MTIRLRLACLLGAAFLCLMLAFGTGVYWVLSVYLYNDVDASLSRSSNLLLEHIADPSRLPTRSLDRALTVGTDIAQVYDSQGNLLASSAAASGLEIRAPATALDASIGGSSTFANTTDVSGSYRIYVVPIRTYDPDFQVNGSVPRSLVIGQDLHGVQSALGELKTILLAAGAIALVVVGLVGWLLAGRGLRPISDLTGAAERLAHSGDVTLRLPATGTNDEVARLSRSFNDSLARLEATYHSLEESLERQRRFVADASHELKTPLTVILTDAETLIDHPEMPDAERRQCLAELRAESARMADLCTSLLQLARGDSPAQMQLSPVSWDEVLRTASRDARLICAPRAVTLTANGGLGRGVTDQGSVLSALRIVFDNIARHTPATSRVELEASGNVDLVWVTVSDTGPGVRPDLLPRIFDRFFRADPARRGQGSGLGLAIAKSTVERLGGSIEAGNRANGGFNVRLELPRQVPAG